MHLGWLDSRHSFSFGEYYDPKFMGHSVLRVINDDTIKRGTGFDAHAHRDMEIISYVLQGTIEHHDSLGNQFDVKAGEVQRMSAGKGILHAEYNASKTQDARLLQIWIRPDKKAIAPSYEQGEVIQTHALTPLVTADGRDGSLSMNQNASIYRLSLHPGEWKTLLRARGRSAYLHVVSGAASVMGRRLQAGDALGVVDATEVRVRNASEAFEALWFDLPA
jgi:redox-sensitive bicupin YhaK (pirin superfamily)